MKFFKMLGEHLTQKPALRGKRLPTMYPSSASCRDDRTLENPPFVNIISGGLPCQDISAAGKGAGIKGSRSGLWGQMHRIIGDVRPDYVIIENSPQLRKRGLEYVLHGLSEIGYDAQWQCLQGTFIGLQQRLS